MNGFQNTEGLERGYFSKECLHREFWEEDHYLMYDPLNIPSLTDTLLKNLEHRTCPAVTKETRTLRNRLRRLPNELQLIIYGYLVQDQEWPLQCTRVLGARFWKVLFNKDYPCMGWLWDLDFGLIQRTDPKLQMDWELLFRKLSQGPKVPDCIGEHPESDYEVFRGVLDHVPPGLEGRRRVWKLVGEMSIGDRSTRWELDPGQALYCGGPRVREEYLETVPDIPEVPVYWGPDGEPVDEAGLNAL
ncbi:hypothetical protein F5883DRAFT_524510 [Diaporthe sp. PMI_573]|nr:hypothetical protein F5883DRAFT_524510 [Diaporthaceae sp. PMI_573]